MNAVIPPKRRDGKSSFVKLVTYVSFRDDIQYQETLSPDAPHVRASRSKEAVFDRLVDYIDRQAQPEMQSVIAEFDDGRQQVKCGDVVCETNCFSLETASAEMNIVAQQNTRCKDPVYHLILSWRREDCPGDGEVFDNARYCLKQLGLSEHQFVTAIHRNTDNLHCHIAVNRINPISFTAASLYNDADVLQKSCRRLEQKYGWTPDNGSWVVNENGDIVRAKREFKSAPRAARQLEYHADHESLYSYAVEHCQLKIDDVIRSPSVSWDDIHDILMSANLELRPKGEGLAIYARDSENLRPIRASSLHPDLTLSCLTERAGVFKPAPELKEFRDHHGQILLTNYIIESTYQPSLHARDRDARLERRIARAEARDDLQARYRAYKNCWVKPALPGGDAKIRFKSLSEEYAIRKRNVRQLPLDPLLKKMLYHGIVADRMIAMAALRVQLREERAMLKMMPEQRRQTYAQWVEQQALNHDVAAIAQLRGWASRAKENALMPSLSKNRVQCAVADDSAPYLIEGYDTLIHRDGSVGYAQQGRVVILDKGDRIELAHPFVNHGQDVVTAFCLAEKKCGEVLEVRGAKEFVRHAINLVPAFNQSGEKPLPLTHPVQRQWAGYNSSPDTPVSRLQSGPKYTPPKPH